MDTKQDRAEKSKILSWTHVWPPWDGGWLGNIIKGSPLQKVLSSCPGISISKPTYWSSKYRPKRKMVGVYVTDMDLFEKVRKSIKQ